MIIKSERLPTGGAMLYHDDGTTQGLDAGEVEAVLAGLIEPPPEPKPLDVRVGDWVRRNDGVLCRVVKVGDRLATLRAVDDPEDETVNGSWAFEVVARLPEGWEWGPRPLEFQRTDPLACAYYGSRGWTWCKPTWVMFKPLPLPDLTHDLTASPEDTLTVLRHVDDLLGVPRD